LDDFHHCAAKLSSTDMLSSQSDLLIGNPDHHHCYSLLKDSDRANIADS
jgi:hypothetical protein